MKKKTTKAAAPALDPVEIMIAVTKFNEVVSSDVSLRAANGNTDYTMKMRKKDPRACIEGDNLCMKRPGAPIKFTITSVPGDEEKYYPTGITFLREAKSNTSDKQRLGLLNFPQNETRMDGRSVFVTDTYKDGKERVRYKFSLLIQRGSDGKIGIIDPGIEHQDDY